MGVGIILISTFPYLHDIIATKEGVKSWVPNIGMVDFLTDSSGKVMGFSSYRVFLYYLFIHLFCHIGFLGWMMDAKGKSYRIALLVPVVLSGYTFTLLLLNARATSFNYASTKFYIAIAIIIIVLVLYYIDHKNKEDIA